MCARKTPGSSVWPKRSGRSRRDREESWSERRIAGHDCGRSNRAAVETGAGRSAGGAATAGLPLPSSEPLKIAEDNMQRLEKLTSLSNVPAVEYQKAKSEVNRLRGVARNGTDRARSQPGDARGRPPRKLEAQMKNSEIRAPMDGIADQHQSDRRRTRRRTATNSSPFLRARIMSAAK